MGALRKILSELWEHPEEFGALMKMRKKAKHAAKLPKDKSLAFCYDMLVKVSRSFAVVIQELHEELRDAVCIFYLVLRALDTVEDDMAIPNETKLPMLLSFWEKCTDRSFTMDCGTDNYKRLMAEYPLVVDCFLKLKKPYQDVIADITKKMGAGMAEYIPIEVETVEQYNKYCYYVAGLVGVGLSNLFAASELETEEFNDMEVLSDSMGKFLQKTNIIRDYLEDIVEEPAPRMFWPKEIWGLYAEELADFKEPENIDSAVQCLNHLVTDALSHLPDCFEYMNKVVSPSVFTFCAIPQVMAIATLAECYNNPKVFKGVVKIRRGLSARIACEVKDMGCFAAWTLHFAQELGAKVQPNKDPNAQKTLAALEQAEDLCAGVMLKLGVTQASHGLGKVSRAEPKSIQDQNEAPIPVPTRIMLWLVFFGYFCYAFGVGMVRQSQGIDAAYIGTPMEYLNKFIAALCLLFFTYILLTGKKW